MSETKQPNHIVGFRYPNVSHSYPLINIDSIPQYPPWNPLPIHPTIHLPKFLVPLLPQGAPTRSPRLLCSSPKSSVSSRSASSCSVRARASMRREASLRHREGTKAWKGREGNQGNPRKMLGKMGIEWDFMGVSWGYNGNVMGILMNHPGIMGILNESSHPANIKHSYCIVPNVCNFLTKPWFIGRVIFGGREK